MNRQELAIAYLLDELDRADREGVERQLERDPALRGEIESLRPVVGKLDRLPGDAWPADPGPAVAPPAPSEGPQERRWSLRPAVALAALLIVAALGAGLGVLLARAAARPRPNRSSSFAP